MRDCENPMMQEALPAYRAEIEGNDDLQDRLDRALTDPGSAFERAVLGPLAKLDAQECAAGQISGQTPWGTCTNGVWTPKKGTG